MPSVTTERPKPLSALVAEAAREILSHMPTQQVRDGGRVDWGRQGNKARALYIAALEGHQFDPECKSCESDLYFVVKRLAK